MYYTRVVSKNFIVLWWFIFCVVRQASSRTCYVCESRINETCSTNVNQSDFKLDCAKAITKFSKSTDESSEILQAIINGYSQEYPPESTSNFDCATIQGSTLNEEKIVRVCIPKSMNCSTLEDHTLATGYLIDTCSRCGADLCNTHVQNKVLKVKEGSFKQKNTQSSSLKEHSNSHASRINYFTTIVFLIPTYARIYL